MCPYYLDGDLQWVQLRGAAPGDTRLHWLLCSFQGPRRARRSRPAARDARSSGRRRGAGLSKLNSMQPHRAQCSPRPCPASVDMLETECTQKTAAPLWISKDPRGRLPAFGALRGGLPRKEVIQPQLPLRLPCYDFTPVTSPTFDGSLPKGLGHRLRVLLTPMV